MTIDWCQLSPIRIGNCSAGECSKSRVGSNVSIHEKNMYWGSLLLNRLGDMFPMNEPTGTVRVVRGSFVL